MNERVRVLIVDDAEDGTEVAGAIGEGKTNADIAAELYMSVATVTAHVSRVPIGRRWRLR
jgi:FixJ family two-component response regulator